MGHGPLTVSTPPVYALWWLIGILLAIGLLAIAIVTTIQGVLRKAEQETPLADCTPRRTHYLVLAVLFAAFVVYGSFLPLQYVPLTMHEAIDRFSNIPFVQLGVGQERADWVASIFFFMPIGFLWLAVLTVDERSRTFAAMAGSLIAIGCTLLSVAVEFVQLWFPPRTVSQNDIIAETIGAILGVLLWLLIGQTATNWFRTYLLSQRRHARMVWLLQSYFLGLTVYSVLPLDFVIHRAELAMKYREGRVELIPLASIVVGRMPLHVAIVHALLWVPIGMLATQSSVRKQPRARSNASAIAIGLVVVVGVEIVRLFVFSCHTSTTNLITGSLGVWAGVWLMRQWRAMLASGSRPRMLRLLETSVWPWVCLAGGYAALVAGVCCVPFKFTSRPESVSSRFQGFLSVPFASFYWGSKFHAVTEALQEVALFVPLGALLARSVLPLPLSTTVKRIALLLALVAASAVALSIDMIQVYQTVHVPDVTDVILRTFGAALGTYMAVALSGKVCQVTRAAGITVVSAYSVVILAAAGMLFWVRGQSGLPVIPESPRLNEHLTYQELTGICFTEIPADPFQAPHFAPIAIPEFHGGHAILGATGSDRRGHTWFGISTAGGGHSPAHLCEYIPEQRQVIDRGDVLSQLKRCGIYRTGEMQGEIHSKIIQGSDGHLYFASTDEEGEDTNGSRLPTWGSHFWRLRLPENRWEHLFTAPEGLIAAAGSGNLIYSLGYFGHVLYQYDVETGKVNSAKIGAVDGHVSRNFLCDHRGHAYVPRLTYASHKSREVRATLVELDAQLEEVGETILEHYARQKPSESRGIVGFQHLADRSIAFVTDSGFLYQVSPNENGPAAVRELGWFHPDGEAYVGSMFSFSLVPAQSFAVAGKSHVGSRFTFSGQRYLLGVSSRNGRFEWLVFDLTTKTSRGIPIPESEPVHSASHVYGSVTRDNEGNFIIVGGWPQKRIDVAPDLERALRTVGVTDGELAAIRSHDTSHRPVLFKVQLRAAASPQMRKE